MVKNKEGAKQILLNNCDWSMTSISK